MTEWMNNGSLMKQKIWGSSASKTIIVQPRSYFYRTQQPPTSPKWNTGASTTSSTPVNHGIRSKTTPRLSKHYRTALFATDSSLWPSVKGRLLMKYSLRWTVSENLKLNGYEPVENCFQKYNIDAWSRSTNGNAEMATHYSFKRLMCNTLRDLIRDRLISIICTKSGERIF